VPAGPTGDAEQDRLGRKLGGLYEADDYLSLIALEREALALARKVRAKHPYEANAVYGKAENRPEA